MGVGCGMTLIPRGKLQRSRIPPESPQYASRYQARPLPPLDKYIFGEGMLVHHYLLILSLISSNVSFVELDSNGHVVNSKSIITFSYNNKVLTVYDSADTIFSSGFEGPKVVKPCGNVRTIKCL